MEMVLLIPRPKDRTTVGYSSELCWQVAMKEAEEQYFPSMEQIMSAQGNPETERKHFNEYRLELSHGKQ